LARARYRVRQLRHTRPFEGIPELLDRLRAHGVRLAVLSNKPHEMTLTIIRAFWPDGAFSRVQGYVEEQYRKPDPHYLRRISEEVGAAPSETCMIGDTPTDIDTAQRGGARSVGVTWGFRTREDLAKAGADCVVDRPAELLMALGLEQ
jgi:phosphoglycolate phosphatase